ncbi:thiamine pyrophosphate-dependent enzyme IolD [Hyphomonas neptunium ATCC 15444]|uniref:Thiamine pyrophosphate-dependent enzyme IolD n=2 Tax=Hyphomonas TaxID=85 RepID=Q0C064_HYPNA|nr:MULTISPECIES: 3D-(3,5/4)-trihydroxycyclohexane-1,2-dione acylhydrolase (decyclizing) [Hyphomonas]ABI77153.1 thiamine pyrophosphate-dependent enzyme IolD [Hyphomonas neptunium ATCC 15444]KCZ90538.1 thiamine pyrophosphate-dependent enzyme IolD [Hyphomonas hirschiana VP5]
METLNLTMSQALVRYLAAQYMVIDGEEVPYFAGVWAIFGHGNVAGLGEALYTVRDELPTYRAHNEQGMAHAAIAYAKASFRRRAMVCTSSIGPGATNFITAAALAHVNRLPVLFLPGDIFANRRPDPVLQQIEDFQDGTVSANDCFRPVSRYFDRITRPEQILTALPRMMSVFTDPASCGPVCLSLCQDVQAEAYDYPASFFSRRVWSIRKPNPDMAELEALIDALKAARRPLFVAGGGALYSGASQILSELSARLGIPVAETQAGRSTLPASHPQNLGAIGVTGTAPANAAAAEADLVLGIGTRLQDFTTGSRTLFSSPGRKLFQLNTAPYDASKHGAAPIVCDAARGLTLLAEALESTSIAADWITLNQARNQDWRAAVQLALTDINQPVPSYADVIGAVDRSSDDQSIVVCAAGTLPGELHKLWRTDRIGGYHMEYGYSCMGYEIAGGMGVKMACPDSEVYVMVGDGSYLMLNSEIATSVMMGLKLIIVLLDSEGFSCINRLQRSTGSAEFNNQMRDTVHDTLPVIDFAAHAASLGAISERVTSVAELEAALARARSAPATTLISIAVNPDATTDMGGHWWDVAVPEVSGSAAVREAFEAYRAATQKQFVD